MKILSTLLVSAALLTGCMHSIHQVHVSDFEPFDPFESGEIVKANSEQFVILGFVSQTSYVDKAYKELQAKCPKGRVQGITTQYSTSLNFFSWTNKILMQGLCVS